MKQIATAILFLLFAKLSFAQVQVYQWQEVGGGVRGKAGSMAGIEAMAVDTIRHLLYVGGGFDTAGNVAAKNLAKWDGVKWDSVFTYKPVLLNKGLVRDLLVIDTMLYIAWEDHRIGQWDGYTYKMIGNAQTGDVWDMIEFNGNLIVCGDFLKIDNVNASCIASWDGKNWSKLSAGLYGAGALAEAMAVYHGELFVGGAFQYAGNGQEVWNIARWNGVVWNALGSGTSIGGNRYAGVVMAIGVYEDSICVTGNFDLIDSISTQGFAIWNGNYWEAFPNDNLLYNVAIQQHGSKLFVGTNRFGVYNGSFQFVLAGGLSGYVSDIELFKDTVYAAGTIGYADTVLLVNRIARLVTIDTIFTPDDKATQIILYPDDIFVYPNPAANVLKVAGALQGKEIQLKTLLGQTLSSSSSGSTKTEFDVSHLPEGVYLLQVGDKNQRVVKKFVKE